MNSFTIRETAYQSPEYQQSVSLREAVLRQPIGMVLTSADLQQDAGDRHIVCIEADRLLGCLVLSPQSADEIQVRQVVVDPQIQRRGIGRALMAFAEDVSRAHGFSRITLHARFTAIPFYELLNYQKVGEPFEQVTLPHWEMEKLL